MKLTRSCQGFRFRKADWPEGNYVDVTWVTNGYVVCKDQSGVVKNIPTSESDSSWIKLGGTTPKKNKESDLH